MIMFRMEGRGEYTFPSGTRYVGDIKDGEFVMMMMLMMMNDDDE